MGNNPIADITFDSLGRLFGWKEGSAANGDDLVSIDKQTGAVTVIPGPLNTEGSGSSFDRDDVYWLFGDREDGAYHTIDIATGAPTLRGTLKPIDQNDSNVSAAAWDCPRTTLYATVNNFGEPPANLVTVDTATGTLANKGQTVTGADGLEWYCPLAFEFGTVKIRPGGKRTIAIPLGRGPRIKGAATVVYSTKNGSAKAGIDFKKLSGTATFPNNVTEQSLALRVTLDPKAGKNRRFTLQLSNPSGGGSVGRPLQVTIPTLRPRLKVQGQHEAAGERATFRLSSNQTPARFRCKLDGGKFKGCGKNGKKAKRFKTPKLDPGPHELVVQAVNSAGRKSKPVKTKFVVPG